MHQDDLKLKEFDQTFNHITIDQINALGLIRCSIEPLVMH
jgi:hypothetical protein